jgi:hypothetical protein
MQGQDGGVVGAVTGGVVGEGTAEAVGWLSGLIRGDSGQGGQALVDGVTAVFYEAVCEEDEGGAAGQPLV